MKEAKDWVDECEMLPSQTYLIGYTQRVQADAIRWAANLSGDLAVKAALDKADELDPPPLKIRL